ncbi:MAG: hypothetical protein K0B10_06485 [Vicingaceae bacterium]|nr:hypothetical protein [Vicingaceae bacterium]
MNNLFLKMILIFLVLNGVFGSFNNIPKNKTIKPKKLLLVATLDDSVVLHRNDTVWIEKASCIELRIDTINTSEIKKYKKRDDLFIYRGNSYERSQLFSLSEYDNLKSHKITSFYLVSAMISYIVNPFNQGNCFEKYTKQKLQSYYNRFEERTMWKDVKIYITDITVLSDEGNKIIVNDIVINMVK